MVTIKTTPEFDMAAYLKSEAADKTKYIGDRLLSGRSVMVFEAEVPVRDLPGALFIRCNHEIFPFPNFYTFPNFTEETFSFVNTYGDKIETRPGVIIPSQTDGTSMMDIGIIEIRHEYAIFRSMVAGR